MHRHALPSLLGALACALVLTAWACAPAQPAVAPLNGAAIEPAVRLPELTFTRSDAGIFTTADTRGRTALFFFGYTHCADVCPLTLAEFGQIRRALGDHAAAVDMYFVTLDPARDTLERMRTYVSNFPGVVGLIGSDAALGRAQTAFNVIAERHDPGNGEYALDHTAAIYLVNAAGQIQLAYPYGTPPDEIVADLHQLISTTQPARQPRAS